MCFSQDITCRCSSTEAETVAAFTCVNRTLIVQQVNNFEVLPKSGICGWGITKLINAA